MGLLPESVRSFLRENAGPVLTTVSSAAVLGAAGATAANFWYLFGVDATATAGLCVSFALVGFLLGCLASWARARLVPSLGMRRAISELPTNQKAVCWRAYRSDGAFLDAAHRGDLVALASAGIVDGLGDRSRVEWSLSPVARRVIGRGKSLSRSLEEAYEAASARARREELERRVDTVLETIDGLSSWDLVRMFSLSDGPRDLDAELEDSLIETYGHLALDMVRVGPVEIRVSLTEAAREAMARRPELFERVAELYEGSSLRPAPSGGTSCV